MGKEEDEEEGVEGADVVRHPPQHQRQPMAYNPQQQQRRQPMPLFADSAIRTGLLQL